MCKEVYRGEGIHVKMREVETYRKPSKTHTHEHRHIPTHAITIRHALQRQVERGLPAWTLWLQALHLSLRKRRKRVFFFHFLFHDLTGATLTLSDLSGCLFVLGSCCEASFWLCYAWLHWSEQECNRWPGTPPTTHKHTENQHCKHRDNVHGSPMGEEGEGGKGGEGYPLARLNPNASNLFSVALRYLHLTSVPLSCQTQL